MIEVKCILFCLSLFTLMYVYHHLGFNLWYYPGPGFRHKRDNVDTTGLNHTLSHDICFCVLCVLQKKDLVFNMRF